MTKQVRHGSRRAGHVKLTVQVTPAMMQDITRAYERMLQCLFDHFIHPQDVRRLAHNPPPKRRRLNN